MHCASIEYTHGVPCPVCRAYGVITRLSSFCVQHYSFTYKWSSTTRNPSKIPLRGLRRKDSFHCKGRRASPKMRFLKVCEILYTVGRKRTEKESERTLKIAIVSRLRRNGASGGACGEPLKSPFTGRLDTLTLALPLSAGGIPRTFFVLFEAPCCGMNRFRLWFICIHPAPSSLCSGAPSTTPCTVTQTTLHCAPRTALNHS